MKETEKRKIKIRESRKMYKERQRIDVDDTIFLENI